MQTKQMRNFILKKKNRDSKGIEKIKEPKDLKELMDLQVIYPYVQSSLISSTKLKTNECKRTKIRF